MSELTIFLNKLLHPLSLDAIFCLLILIFALILNVSPKMNRLLLVTFAISLGLLATLTACAPSANPPEIAPPESPSPSPSPS